MIRTLVLLSILACCDRTSEAQCSYLSNSSGGGAFIHCFGEPNLGCASFYVMVDQMDPAALTSVAFFAYCDAGPVKYFDPPIACAQRCIVFPEIPAVPIVLHPSPSGRSYVRFYIPSEPVLFHEEICTQVAEMRVIGGRACLALSNAIRIRVSSGFCN
ncbi:MAG: hypothetical protein H6834_15630 [Planctomycetes bacterium]|nr:hypothetical protein [Planctomycetota bacterium]